MLWLNFIFENLFFQNLLYILFFKKRATFFNNFVGFINLRGGEIYNENQKYSI